MSVRATAVENAVTFEFGQSEIAEGASKTLYVREIGDAALLHGFNDARIFLDHLLEFVKFHFQNGRLNVFALLPEFELVTRNVHQGFNGNALAKKNNLRFTKHRVAKLPGENFLLGWFMEKDTGVESVDIHFAGIAKDVVNDPIFLGLQRLKRMRGCLSEHEG